MSTKRLPFTQWADISRTERFIAVKPLSGYRMIRPEDDSCVIYLLPDATDDALGQALLEALDKSRFIWPPDDPEFFEAKRYMQSYQNAEKDFMRRYNYKTKREAHKNMNWCRAERSGGTISIEPHNRDNKPGHWKWLTPDKTVVIPATPNATIVGAALRLALDRCE